MSAVGTASLPTSWSSPARLAVRQIAAGAPSWRAISPARRLTRHKGEAATRVEAREAASAWLARSSRADDVLFGYDPLFLGGWERDRAGFSDTVIPRADAKLALRSLREAGTLGRGVWVFDASDTNNFTQKLTIPLRYPNPRSDFEARAFGPFLVIRSTEPTRTPKEFLLETRQAQILGRSLGSGDADVNLLTADQALSTLER